MEMQEKHTQLGRISGILEAKKNQTNKKKIITETNAKWDKGVSFKC